MIVRILVADDFVPWARFISSLLQKEPRWHVVCEVSDGLEAVEKAIELAPNLVLLDIGLPKLNGIEAARQIRKLAPNSTILFVSTYDSVDIIEAALSTGARGYVVKASVGRELIQAVEAVLHGKVFVSRLDGARAEVLQATSPKKDAAIGRHEAQFCPDDECLLDGFGRCIEVALKAENIAVVVATESHREALLPRLAARGLDIAAATGQGRYIALDALDVRAAFMVGGLPVRDRFLKLVGELVTSAANAAKGPSRRVVVCTECAPLLWAEGKVEAAIRLEALWNELTKTHDVSILCGYSSKCSDSLEDGPILRRIRAVHSAVYPSELDQ